MKHLAILAIFGPIVLFSQPNFTANDLIAPYSGPFRAGVNPGAHPPFSDSQLADLSAGNDSLHVAGVGCRAWRPGLFEHFLEDYGYDIRKNEFEHAFQIGLKDNTAIVGFSNEAHRDHTEYCPGHESTLFANMYEPIWDGGANGTPVNEQNFYAVYLWKAASQYKNQVRFWEIWNEPGFDYSFLKSYLDPGQPGNWWENNPDPCDYKLRAPIQHYIRLLRISYEIIKTIDPSAYVLCGGVGYPSFLDAILRNTDNPGIGSAAGSLNADFPKKGGAYFDVLGFHAYPHFDASTQVYDNATQQFIYSRHSDGAAAGIGIVKNRFEPVLKAHGYDGSQFPEKLWTITEANIPRKGFGYPLGSDAAQRNYVIKAWVESLRQKMLQLHIYAFSEETELSKATYEFDVMGLYKKLDFNDLYFQRVNESGIALKTANDLLFEKTFDEAGTTAMNLPQNVGGAALKDANGNRSWILWAKTQTDLSEVANATFSFPNGLISGSLLRREWDFSKSLVAQTSSPVQPIQLTAAPVFFEEKTVSLSKYAGCAPLVIDFSDQSGVAANSILWTFSGGSPATSTASGGSVTFSQSGTYDIFIQKKNAAGQVVFLKKQTIVVEEKPVAEFAGDADGAVVYLKNQVSPNTDSFAWDFGDGNISSDPNPVHVFYQSGQFPVVLTASNECGNSVKAHLFQIDAPNTTMVSQTADEFVAPNLQPFRPGILTRYAAGWSDEQQADLGAGNLALAVEGAGVKTLKVTLPEDFLETFGYDIRLATFQHYLNVDLQENTAVLGFPGPDVRETWPWCPTDPPVVFKNLYADIWDGGLNGTPVNEQNPFANYVWQAVETYKNQVRYWQIYDGVDYDATGAHGWLPPGEPGNWWQNDPDPCETSLRTPVQFYIRMLRIAYEIVHNSDPDGQVLVGGIGYPSFLDVILRNTDNLGDGSPGNLPGSVQPGYERRGGAFFDAFGFNNYPFVDGSTKYYDTNLGQFVYKRHSDAAADGLLTQQTKYENVFKNHGFDGATHPKKVWLVSETGVSRKIFQDYFGGEPAQRNWLLKAWINAQKSGFAQMTVFNQTDGATPATALFPSDLMGLYENIDGKLPFDATKNDLGWAYETASQLLFKLKFDAAKTMAMNLPTGVRGAAFKDFAGKFLFAIWAETTVDNSENATASYLFPAGIISGNSLTRFNWDFSKTKMTATQPLASPILLTATPVFFTENSMPPAFPMAAFSADKQTGCAGLTVQFEDNSANAATRFWEFPGGSPASSTAQNPTVTYSTSGDYAVSLTVQNALGEHNSTEFEFIKILPKPTADFDIEYAGPLVHLTNTSSPDADSIKWIFWDGSVQFGYYIDHYFFQNGSFPFNLVAFNECGSDTVFSEIIINLKPSANFNVVLPTVCGQLAVHFQDVSGSSPMAWSWQFQGGQPAVSSEQYPTVVYPGSGSFSAILIVSNSFGSDTLVKIFDLSNAVYSSLKPAVCAGGSFVLNGQIFDKNQPAGQVVLAGASWQGCDSIVVVELQFLLPPVTDLFAQIQAGQTWLFDNQQLTTAGVYFDTMKTVSGCDSVLRLNLQVVVGIDDLRATIYDLRMRPNPFSESLFIEWETAVSGPATVSIFAGDGRLVFEKTGRFSEGKNSWSPDLSGLSAGVFFVKLVDETGVRWGRVVKI